MTVELAEAVASLRAKRLTPRQIARKLGQPRARVAEIVRSIARDAALASQAGGQPDPLYVCRVSAGWSSGLGLEGEAAAWAKYDEAPRAPTGGMAVVTVARKPSRGRLVAASFLVDTWARGVRDVIGPHPTTERKLAELEHDVLRPFGGQGFDVPVDLARSLVFGSVAYAERFGHRPPTDFENARSLLGDGPIKEGLIFGHFGSPPAGSRGDFQGEVDLHDWDDEHADSMLAGQMVPFDVFCPDVAERETRSATVPGGDTFGFLECFCADPNCDCRRVMISVVSHGAQRIEATISHGLEGADPELDLPQTFLEPGGEQGPNARKHLALFEEVLLADPKYRARLRRHYDLFKATVADQVGLRENAASREGI